MKLIKTILLFVILAMPVVLLSQRIINVQATIQDDQVLIGYQVKGLQCQQSIKNLSFYVSKDDGHSYYGPLNELSGDIKSGIRNGKYIVAWDALNELPFTNERLIFDVRAEIKEKKRKRAIMLSYVGNVKTPLGGRIGQLGKVSWYLEGRASLLSGQAAQYSYSGNNLIGYDKENNSVNPTGDDGWKAYSGIVGTTIQTDCNFFIYLGIGYGFEQFIKKFDETDEQGNAIGSVWAKDESKSIQGVEMDGGVIFRYKKLIVSGGITVLNLEKYNWTMGVGVAF